MKKYYIYINYQQDGPFSLEELKEMKINRETMIWFEGQNEWLQANKIDELKELFKSIPPPINIPNPATKHTNSIEDKETIYKTEKLLPTQKYNYTGILIVLGLLLLIFVGGIVYYNQDKKQQNIESQLEEQNSKIQEQERIEANRIKEEKQQKRREELQTLKIQLDEAVTNLRYANEKLNEIKQFQLFRAQSERESQIQSQLEIIRSCENEVERIQGEINKY